MSKQIPPDTAEGWAVLHTLYTVDWPALAELSSSERGEIAKHFADFAQSRAMPSEEGQSGYWHLLGHMGDIMALHYAKRFEDLAYIEHQIAQLPIARYLKSTYSFTSMVELGLYYATVNVRHDLEEEGIAEDSDAWKKEYAERIEKERGKLLERRYTLMPEKKYLSFYPMNKRRSPGQNWYAEPLARRSVLMMEHGHTGRKYAGRVHQIISGSIGFDDWEWAVDLFSDDALAIKRLVYEIRFDEGSALYADFGPFYLGVRLPASECAAYLCGEKVSAFTSPSVEAPSR